eukprot:TRINITY_DN6621_c0_g1_i1.p1 TRINITY_DN6621_c0_g1~~TRINITY_DN6621_c0_g1_i1.p1  ORF type:complete len:293 (+),score=55.38 TRINITY_DN6621_c0_g1_i1:142-1020(+)
MPENLCWSEISDDDDFCDTLMLKNIPSRCSQDEVLALLDEAGFGDAYHFFYLPRRTTQGQCHGYAFVGLRDTSMAGAFIERVSGMKVKSRNSNKAISVTYARIQGIDNNLKHFRETRCTKGKWKPFFARDMLDNDDAVMFGAFEQPSELLEPGQMHASTSSSAPSANTGLELQAIVQKPPHNDCYLNFDRFETMSTSESGGGPSSTVDTDSMSDFSLEMQAGRCADGSPIGRSISSSPSSITDVLLQVTPEDNECDGADECLWRVSVDKTFITVKPDKPLESRLGLAHMAPF